MKTLALVLAAPLCVIACSNSDDDAKADGGSATGGAANEGDGSVAPGGSGGSGGSDPQGTGGAAGGTCPALNFNTAPLECLQDWTHAVATYPKACAGNGGYQATCEGLDVIVYALGTRELRCWYSPTTGNLIGWQSLGSPARCGSFDPEFSAVDVGNVTCTPKNGNCDTSGQ